MHPFSLRVDHSLTTIVSIQPLRVCGARYTQPLVMAPISQLETSFDLHAFLNWVEHCQRLIQPSLAAAVQADRGFICLVFSEARLHSSSYTSHVRPLCRQPCFRNTQIKVSSIASVVAFPTRRRNPSNQVTAHTQFDLNRIQHSRDTANLLQMAQHTLCHSTRFREHRRNPSMLPTIPLQKMLNAPRRQISRRAS